MHVVASTLEFRSANQPVQVQQTEALHNIFLGTIKGTGECLLIRRVLISQAFGRFSEQESGCNVQG